MNRVYSMELQNFDNWDAKCHSCKFSLDAQTADVKKREICVCKTLQIYPLILQVSHGVTSIRILQIFNLSIDKCKKLKVVEKFGSAMDMLIEQFAQEAIILQSHSN